MSLWLAFAIAANLAGLAFSLTVSWLHARAIRRWRALSDLLAEIAVQSFMLHHNGTFAAWAAAMGHIEVAVTASQRAPRDTK